MAWQVWKDCWYPGTVHLRDGRKITYTAAQVKAGVPRAKEMLSAGLGIPVAWVHDLENVARDEAQLAEDIAARNRHTFARAVDARLHEKGHMEVLLRGDDDEDLKQLPKTGFVSPQINTDFIDGRGRSWPGLSVAHVAVVSNPIQLDQQPFQLSADAAAPPVWLAADAYENGDKNMADEPKDGEGGDTGEQAACPGSLIEALQAAGLTIPGEVKTIADLIIAVKAGMKVEDGAGKDAATGTEASPPPVAMSADAQVLARKVAALEGELLRGKRADFEKRAIACAARGALTPTDRDAWIRQVRGAVQLSADGSAKGSIPVQLSADLAAHEKLPDDSIWATGRKTARGGEAPLPADAVSDDDGATRKRAEAYAKSENERVRRQTA